MKQNYEKIINWPAGISVFDCDSTVIASHVSPTGETITTWEGLSDAALALGRRIGNHHIAQEVDSIAQKAMSTPGAVFEDSLTARFEILCKYWLTKQDVVLWAQEAVFSKWFDRFIQLKNWLTSELGYTYQPYFFLSAGFWEMLETCLLQVIPQELLHQILFTNRFLYDGEDIIGFDTETSQVYKEGAKKHIVEQLRADGKIFSWATVYGVWDGSNDILMSDTWYFVAYSGVKRREKVIEVAGWVEAIDFFEVSVFHTSPEERKYILNSGNQEVIDTLQRGVESLRRRINWIDIY